MRVGIPREIKEREARVALLPAEVRTLVEDGNEVRVEQGAGSLSGVGDNHYLGAGAHVLADPAELYAGSELIVKVKEFQPGEYHLLLPDHVVFANLHTALNRDLTDHLLSLGLVAISAEETHRDGSPNSGLAGEIGALEGVRLCLAPHGGAGRHFMGRYGVEPVRALILGLGGAGRGAARTLVRLGCRVAGLDIDAGARARFDLDFDSDGTEDVTALQDFLPNADLVVNCVLWPKHRGDHLITRAMLTDMKPGAVIVDVSCDTAGAVETTRPTRWSYPVYTVDGVRHFCVDNIPAAVPGVASAGYAAAILPHVRAIAESGWLEACRRDPWLARGLTCVGGTLVLEETGRVQNRRFTPVETYLTAPGSRPSG